MTYGKAILIICLGITTLEANLRAPVHINRAGTELRSDPAALIVLGESLEFECPEAYTGGLDMALLARRFCDARVRYRIRAAKKERVMLTFVFAGEGQVWWRLGERILTNTIESPPAPKTKNCPYCPDQLRKTRFSAQVIEFEPGENELEISYHQALSATEHGHSYFSAGKWTQSFTYELWPIAEWQWAENLTATIRFAVAARSGTLGIGFKDDILKCAIKENEKLIPVSLKVAPVAEKKRVATASVKLARKPQQLYCSYEAD